MQSKSDPLLSFIIITSDEPWCEVWHTQLHYAFQLSKKADVVFLGPPEPWKFSNLFKVRLTHRSESKTLRVINYFNWLPASLGRVALWINDKINAHLLRRHVQFPNSSQYGIVWHFDPHRSFYIYRGIERIKHIFHVIDPIAGCNLDVPLAKSADLVIVTSPRFTDYYSKLNNNVIQIGQGVDLNFYNEQDYPSDHETAVSKHSILLLGTISDQLHFEILGKIAIKFPGKLVLIGPDKTITPEGKSKFKDLLSIEGVTWLGAMPPVEFRKHLRSCKIGIISYDNSINAKNEFRSPLKVIGYLAAGKCIISNIPCEVDALIDKAIYNVNSAEEYFDLISKGYADELNFDDKAVRGFLESINYVTLIDQIFDKLKLPANDTR